MASAQILPFMAEYQVLAVLALVLAVGFQAKWIRSLRNTVSAQTKSIEAQKGALDALSMLATTMRGVLESRNEEYADATAVLQTVWRRGAADR